MRAATTEPKPGECWRLKGQHQEDAHARIVDEANAVRFPGSSCRVLWLRWRGGRAGSQALRAEEVRTLFEFCAEHPPLTPGGSR